MSFFTYFDSDLLSRITVEYLIFPGYFPYFSCLRVPVDSRRFLPLKPTPLSPHEATPLFNRKNLRNQCRFRRPGLRKLCYTYGSMLQLGNFCPDRKLTVIATRSDCILRPGNIYCTPKPPFSD